MSNQTVHVIAPRPPMRAFLVAAVLTFLGAALVALAAGHHAAVVWVVLAAVVLLAGIALACAGAVSMRRMRTFVTLDDDGYRITAPGTDQRGEWADVTRVTSTANGAHLTLHHGEVGRTHIISPAGGGDPAMASLATDIAHRLDDSRGYGETMNVPLIDPHNPNPDVVS